MPFVCAGAPPGNCLWSDDDEPLVLPQFKQEQLLKQSRECVRAVIGSMLTTRRRSSTEELSTQEWTPKMHKNGVSYFVDKRVEAAQQTRFCCVSHTYATVDELMELCVATDTPTLVKQSRIMYNNVLDTRVVSVLEAPTRQTPNKCTYVRYTSFASNSALIRDRDMCVVVATNTFRHTDGSYVGYCLWNSVDLPQCPELVHSHGIVRCRMVRSGYFFRSWGAPNTLTKIVYIVGAEAGGIAPRLVTNVLMERFGDNLSRLCANFRRQVLDAGMFVSSAEWRPKSRVKCCSLCQRTFHPLIKRTNCVACGDVICNACHTTEDVRVPGAKLAQVRICVACLNDFGIAARPRARTCTMMAERATNEVSTEDRDRIVKPHVNTVLYESSSSIVSLSRVHT